MRTRLIAILVPLLTLAMATVGTAAAAPPDGTFVDVIVVLEDGSDAPAAAAAAARAHDAEIGFVYEAALQGYSARVPAGRLHALQRDPRVVSVEVDQVASIAAQTVPTGIQRIFADDNTAIGIDGSDNARVDVDVAVIDTGVDFQHPDLNVVGGVDCTLTSGRGPVWSRTAYCSASEGTGGDDDHYHGTHVAGTIGALDNGTGVVGVAPGARIWAVKVLDSSGSGYTSGIIAGIDWVTAQGDIEVANMSLGGSGSCSSAYQTAISNAVASGVAMVVAAGNSNTDANNYSPASCRDTLTVSALADFDGAPGGTGSPTCRTDQDDTLADFSNWGSAIDIAAPGVCILSTYPLEQGEYATISGTSMASPHAAGAAALLMSGPEGNWTATDVAAVYASLKNSGNLNWTDDSGDGVKERLLDVTGYAPKLTPNDGGGGDPPPPSGDIAMTATGYKVKGIQTVDLTWSGAKSTNVDIHRGSTVITTLNDGAHTDNIGNKGGGSYTYKVCEAGTSTCSATVTVTF